MDTVFYTLRTANEARHIEWSKGDGDGTYFYAVELFGEAGEALNVVKKLVREHLGMVGSRATAHDLAEELADVVICIDLLAMAYQRPPSRPVAVYGSDPLRIAVALGRVTGEIMGHVEDLGDYDVETAGYAFADLTESLDDAHSYVAFLAAMWDIDLDAAVLAKFNKTSAKYGLQTCMAETASLY